MEQPPDTIALEDLTLRRWVPGQDLDEFFQVIEESLDHLRPWMPWVAHHSRQSTAEYLERAEANWLAGEAYSYALVSDGRVVGNCAFFLRDADADPAGREIGYWLHPAATGRGFVVRAAAALVEQAFALPGIGHLEIVHDAANLASAAVPRRLGFTERLRRPAQQELACGESGTDVIWRLDRP
ncbi:GNAT family N-acetyltransferase [Kitasatospora kazusensis]|uniref:GNAT family N-acetyltransferase n=1 Tax=Kitasatospora kazusensis TaxID=407974 RepID=A0ABN2ZS26_9ACTN